MASLHVKLSLAAAHRGLGSYGWPHSEEMMVLEAKVVGRRGTSHMTLRSQVLQDYHQPAPGVGISPPPLLGCKASVVVKSGLLVVVGAVWHAASPP